MNNNNTGNQHQGGGNSGTGGNSGGSTGTRLNPMDLRMDLSNLNNNNNNNMGGGTGMTGITGASGMPSPRVAASGLRRSSHNSSPAIFSGSSSMRRTMSGSKRSAPNEDFGGGSGGGGGLGMVGHQSSRNVHRTRPSMMSRSSTFTASTSTNAVWDFNHQGGGGSVGNANWGGGGGGGGGGSGVGFGSGGMGGGGEEASYQQSVGRSMNNLGGGRNPGSNPFLSQMQGGGGSSTDMAQLLNKQNLLQQTAPSSGGSGGSGSGMGGAGLVFDPRLGTVGLAGAGGSNSNNNNNINNSGRRIPNPSGADFMAMMGLKRPDGGAGGLGEGGGGSSNSSMAGGSSNSSLHSHQHRHSGGMEVPLNDATHTGGHGRHQQQVGPSGSIQGVKMQKRGSAMLRRSSHNLTELQRFKMPEEEGADAQSEDDSIGNANFGGGGGSDQQAVLEHLQRSQQQQQQQPTATSTATEIAQRMQELRREQEKAQQTVSAKSGSSGADGSTSVQQEQGQAGDAGSQASVDTGLSNLSGFSDISASDMQLLFNEELGGTGPGGGSSAGGSAGSLGSGLAGFDFDQHAREVAAEVTDQVAAELMAGGGGVSDGSGGASRTGVVDGGSAAAAAAVDANTATGSGGELEVDYGSLLAHFEPTPLSAQSEQLLHARRQSNMSMGSEHSGTSALASGISTMGGLGGVPPIPVADPSSTSSTPGLHQTQAQQQFQEQQQFSSVGTSMGSAASTGMPASPAIPQMQQQAQFPQQVMQSTPVASATASMAVAPDHTNSSNPSAAAISVQSQLQHVAHGGAGAQQGVVSGLGVKGIDGPRDASWMVSAILQLSKVGPRVPDRDGLLPVHLACLYCPNEKKLVGNILIDNPESATFIVSPPPENLDVEGANANPQDVIMSLTSNALAAARKKANPSVMMSQLQGSYPLHIVLRSFGGEKVTYEVVKLLALSGPGVLTTPDPFGCVPLSIALQNKVGSQIIRYLLEQNKDSARVPDRDGNYPLHHACMSARGKKKYSLAIIKLLTQSYPKALAKKNKEGKKPLDLAYGPKGRDDYLNEGKTDSAIEFLEKTYEKLKRKQQEKIASKG